MTDPTLLELVKEVRWKTLKLLEGVSDAQARFVPPGLNNHILWHAGHSLIVVEHLGCMPLSGKPPQYQADWFDKFSWKSTPATVQSWPALAEVVAALIDQRTRLNALLEAASSESLDRVIGDPPRSRTLRGTVLHGLHDEAGHQGEIHLLKKLAAVKG